MLTILDVPASAPSALQVLWLILVAVLWIGFFFFEGFDFGVGMLIPFLGKTDQHRRLIINTVGPHWDGNEVWLLTAGGAMFAAFSGWYATLFSGLYLPLFLVLLGLIIRGVGFEYRSKHDTKRWRTTWDWLLAIGSFLPALVFGVGFANFLKGLPVGPYTTAFGNQVTLYTGTFWGLFMPFCLIGGLMLVALFVAHGSFFIALKTRGEIHDRAQKYGTTIGIIAGVLTLVFVIWGNAAYHLPGQLGWLRAVAWITGIIAIVAVIFAIMMNNIKRDGWAFFGSSVATAMLVIMFFCHFYPGLGFDNSVNTGTPLDLTTASSSPMTLKIMTIAACCMVPIVLIYTLISYLKVFRRRLSTDNIPEVTIAA